MYRRDFLKLALASASAAGLTLPSFAGTRASCPFKLGLAGYTFYRFSFDEALALLKRFEVKGFCAKDKHFPFPSSGKITESELKDRVKKCQDAGVTIYGAGPITVKDEDEAKRAFDYAALLGVPTIVIVPAEKYQDGAREKLRSSRRMCEAVSKLAEAYRIDCGIHNHGANPKTGNPALYPTLVATDTLIHDLSPRLGYCMDVAYTVADGFDPVEIIRRFAKRIFDVHFRNVSDLTNGSSGASAASGKIDYVKIVRALKDVGYNRWCGLELANAYSKPSAVNPGADPAWIPLSLGYFQGIMDAVAV